MDEVTFGQVLNFATVVIVPMVVSIMGLWVKQIQEKSNADILVLQGQVAYLTEQLNSRDETIREQAAQIKALQTQVNEELRNQAKARKRF